MILEGSKECHFSLSPHPSSGGSLDQREVAHLIASLKILQWFQMPDCHQPKWAGKEWWWCLQGLIISAAAATRVLYTEREALSLVWWMKSSLESECRLGRIPLVTCLPGLVVLLGCNLRSLTWWLSCSLLPFMVNIQSNTSLFNALALSPHLSNQWLNLCPEMQAHFLWLLRRRGRSA